MVYDEECKTGTKPITTTKECDAFRACERYSWVDAVKCPIETGCGMAVQEEIRWECRQESYEGAPMIPTDCTDPERQWRCEHKCQADPGAGYPGVGKPTAMSK